MPRGNLMSKEKTGERAIERPSCPHCGRQISFLNVTTSGTYFQRFFVHPGYGIAYEDDKFEGNGEILVFSCPHCLQRIVGSEADAARFFGLKE